METSDEVEYIAHELKVKELVARVWWLKKTKHMQIDKVVHVVGDFVRSEDVIIDLLV